MRFNARPSFGPDLTPYVIRWLIALTCTVSLACGLTNKFIRRFFEIWSLQDLLSVSPMGLLHGYLWQPATALFVFPSAFYEITFSYLTLLTFNMYILWIIGTILVEKLGKGAFLSLYLTSGILAGLIATGVMILIGQYEMIAGPTPAIFALLTTWIMIYPEQEIYLFFAIPFKAKWLVLGIFGVVLLMTLSQGALSTFAYTFTGTIVGYLYSTLVWGLHTPFTQTHRLDALLANLGARARRLFGQKPKKNKIINLETEESLEDDDAFIDAMLAKISQHGEQSLSWPERRRMDKIANQKMGSH